MYMMDAICSLVERKLYDMVVPGSIVAGGQELKKRRVDHTNFFLESYSD